MKKKKKVLFYKNNEAEINKTIRTNHEQLKCFKTKKNTKKWNYTCHMKP